MTSSITDLTQIGHKIRHLDDLCAGHLQQEIAMRPSGKYQSGKQLCRHLLLVAVILTSPFWPAKLPSIDGILPYAVAEAATKLPAVDAALAAQFSDQARKDWNPDAELVQLAVTATGDGSPDGGTSSTPVTFFFRADNRGYQMTLSRYGNVRGAQAPLPRNATEAVPITFISLKDALALARAKGFSQTTDLHPVLQSFISTDGLQRIGWLFAAPGDPLDKQIFVASDGHQVGTVQHIFGSLRQ